MGTFNIEVELLPKRFKVSALVDTGATFSKFPSDILNKLGVKVDFKTKVELGDGRKIERKVGYVKLRVNGRMAKVPVVFGGKGERPLVGATALEIMGLVPEPRKKLLIESLHLEITEFHT